MKKILLFVSFAVLSIVIVNLTAQPATVSAGGWQCFVCHGGVEAVGSDLAPPLAGSKLTDEQILAQVRHPRGMMPAFSEREISDENLKAGFVQPFIRSGIAGRPTATLSPQNRSIALAMLAGVAAARATEYAQATPPAPIASAATATSAPSVTPFATTVRVAQNKPTQAENAPSINLFVTLSGLLVAGGGLFWFSRARR